MSSTTFDSSKITLFAVVDGAPLEIHEGLNFDGDFFQMEKIHKEEANLRKGLKDSSYMAVNTADTARTLTLEWIPGSPAIKIMEGLIRNRKEFNMIMINDSDPAWKFSADSCRIAEEPGLTINGKEGFKNHSFKITCPRSQYAYI